MNREQKLIDILFECFLLATDPAYIKHFGKLSIEDRAKWVSDQLRGCGFDTSPRGASWGVLK